jgi:hypothetical protein
MLPLFGRPAPRNSIPFAPATRSAAWNSTPSAAEPGTVVMVFVSVVVPVTFDAVVMAKFPASRFAFSGFVTAFGVGITTGGMNDMPML